jgi:hypothetical protein
MYSICKNFAKIGEDLFQIVKVYPEERILNVDLVKQWLGTEIVFRKDANLYFCNRIQELEIINENEQTETP